MARRWLEALHPRDRNGRFRSKTKVSFRLGTRSATFTVGRSIPIIPGKVGLHLGVLARIESLSEKRGYLAKLSDMALAKIAKIAPQKQRAVVLDVLKRRKATVGGVQIHQIGGQRRARSVKLSNASMKPGKSVTSGTRAPNRKPRTRSLRSQTNGRRLQR
jgi:hypothetical protein